MKHSMPEHKLSDQDASNVHSHNDLRKVTIALSGPNEYKARILEMATLYFSQAQNYQGGVLSKTLFQKQLSDAYSSGYQNFEPTYYLADKSASHDASWNLKNDDSDESLTVAKNEFTDWSRFVLSVDVGIKEDVLYNAVILHYMVDQVETLEFLRPIAESIRGNSKDVPILLVGIQSTEGESAAVIDSDVTKFCIELSVSFACQFSIEKNEIEKVILDSSSAATAQGEVLPKSSVNAIYEKAVFEGDQFQSAVLKRPSVSGGVFRAANRMFDAMSAAFSSDNNPRFV